MRANSAIADGCNKAGRGGGGGGGGGGGVPAPAKEEARARELSQHGCFQQSMRWDIQELHALGISTDENKQENKITIEHAA